MTQNPNEIQMSAVRFTAREESGSLSRDLGLAPNRIQMPPRDAVPIWSVKYAHEPLRSAGRPAPLRRA